MQIVIQNIQSQSKRKDGTGFYFYAAPNLPLPQELRWKGAYISDRIYRGMAERPEYCRGVPLNMACLREALGRKAVETVKAMLSCGIIKRVGGYTPGESSYKYVLLPPYDQCERIECPDRDFIRKIVRASEKRPPVVAGLEQHARALRIDADPAMNAIKTLRPKKQDGNAAEARESARRCVRIIEDGGAHMWLDRHHGRVFAPHTSLNSQLRRYLQAPDGQPIVSLDIRNCQPLVLILAMAAYYHPDRNRRNRLLNLERIVDAPPNPYLSPQLKTIAAPFHNHRGAVDPFERPKTPASQLQPYQGLAPFRTSYRESWCLLLLLPPFLCPCLLVLPVRSCCSVLASVCRCWRRRGRRRTRCAPRGAVPVSRVSTACLLPAMVGVSLLGTFVRVIRHRPRSRQTGVHPGAVRPAPAALFLGWPPN